MSLLGLLAYSNQRPRSPKLYQLSSPGKLGQQLFIVGLSKERPILDHHAKAHIFEIRWISCEIHPKPYKIRCFNKNSSVWGVQEGGYDPGFHEILVHSPSPAFIKLNSFG